jgi:hypothetical protein
MSPVNVRPMPPEPPDNAPFNTKLAWLLATHGYCEMLDRIVKLYEPSIRCLIQRPAFTFSRKPWHEIIVGPRGGEDTVYAAAEWAARKERPNIHDIRMRPDRDFPTYRENGELFKNTYRHPIHQGAGDIEPFEEFMEHLVPVEFERNWFLNWLAFKWRHPEIPGIAVVMVATEIDAQTFGTGRGFLFDILQRLFSPNYAKHIAFDILSGKSSQSAFTDWRAFLTLAFVTEAKDTDDAGAWRVRHAVFEHLKSIIDPRAIEQPFTRKNFPLFYALCFCSFIIATNNIDALQLPAGDRRFAVLANGVQMAAEMAVKLQAWLEQPGNIAALARWLEARDIDAFKPFEAPETLSKEIMQQAARTDRDEAFAAVRKLFGKAALFTGEQFKRAMQAELLVSGPELDAWMGHKLRQTTTSNKEEFRMPERASDKKRLLILRWRDYDGPKVTTREEAMANVAVTDKLLSAKDEAQAEFLRGMFVHMGRPPD